VAAYPVLALMVLQRVYLPAFARMQTHKERLGEFVEKVILATNAVVAPLAIFSIVLIRPLTVMIFGAKWLVALPLFKFFWLANIFVATATPLMGLLNALGRSRTTFGFAVGWMLGTWALGVPLTLFLGVVGFALANLIVNLSNLVLFRLARNYVNFRILPIILPEWLLAVAMGLVIYGLKTVWPVQSLLSLSCYGILAIVFFGLGMLVLYSSDIAGVWASLKPSLPGEIAEGASCGLRGFLP
jgi:O-antigen/teichoic acid export membrane protein